MKTTITWYLVRNHAGQFLYGEDGNSRPRWGDNIEDARLYKSIGPAKSAVTKFMKHNPDLPPPQVLEWVLDIATANVIDVSQDSRKSIIRAHKEKLRQDELNREYERRRLLSQRDEISAKLSSLQ